MPDSPHFTGLAGRLNAVPAHVPCLRTLIEGSVVVRHRQRRLVAHVGGGRLRSLQ